MAALESLCHRCQPALWYLSIGRRAVRASLCAMKGRSVRWNCGRQSTRKEARIPHDSVKYRGCEQPATRALYFAGASRLRPASYHRTHLPPFPNMTRTRCSDKAGQPQPACAHGYSLCTTQVFCFLSPGAARSCITVTRAGPVYFFDR